MTAVPLVPPSLIHALVIDPVTKRANDSQQDDAKRETTAAPRSFASAGQTGAIIVELFERESRRPRLHAAIVKQWAGKGETPDGAIIKRKRPLLRPSAERVETHAGEQVTSLSAPTRVAAHLRLAVSRYSNETSNGQRRKTARAGPYAPPAQTALFSYVEHTHRSK